MTPLSWGATKLVPPKTVSTSKPLVWVMPQGHSRLVLELVPSRLRRRVAYEQHFLGKTDELQLSPSRSHIATQKLARHMLG